MSCGTTWGFIVPIFTDRGSGAASIVPLSTLTNFGYGYTFVASRAWRATDNAGNSSTCTRVASCVDISPPVITSSPADQNLG